MSNKDKVVNYNQSQSEVPAIESNLITFNHVEGQFKMGNYEHLCYVIERLKLQPGNWTTQ